MADILKVNAGHARTGVKQIGLPAAHLPTRMISSSFLPLYGRV